MKYVGIDLHKKTSVVCVMNKDRNVIKRQTFPNSDPTKLEQFFCELGPFAFAVEASGSHEWLVKLLEPLAAKWVLVNAARFEVISKSLKKTDRHDAQKLAEFLVAEMLPQAYFASPKEREHRVLVRYRVQCRRRVNSLVCRIRQVASRYNADRTDLLKSQVMDELQQRDDLSSPDRFVLKRLANEHQHALEELEVATAELRTFAKNDTEVRKKERELLKSAPGVGVIVADVVLAEIGNVQRFSSIKDVTAYAGLVPRLDESGDKAKQLHITKAGSKLLRWAMVQAAWQAIRQSSYWSSVYEGIKKRRGGKRAIVAVARRLLGVLASMLRKGETYRWSLAELKHLEARVEARRQKRLARAAASKAAASKPSAQKTPPETPLRPKAKSSRKSRQETTVMT